jgi:hypothetical protein
MLVNAEGRMREFYSRRGPVGDFLRKLAVAASPKYTNFDRLEDHEPYSLRYEDE